MDAIDRIRAFNRAHTRRIGLLEQGYLSEARSLPEMRLLFELSTVPGRTARALAEDLGVNEGYLSRLIAGLEAAGLVTRQADAADRRRKCPALTEAGADFMVEMQARSRSQIADWFAERPAGTADRVAELLDRAEDLLSPDPPPVALTDLRPGDAGWLVERHAALYARDEGFDRSFEVLVARILAEFLETHDPATERGWIARQGTDRLGSIFCVKGPAPGLAKLRLFLLVPEARGRGLGQRLLDTCLAFARSAGYRRMVLWTHESHQAACALYRKNGFDCLNSHPVRSFGVDLVEQEWARDL